MYRTGDRGSRGPNGEIQFAGRADRQVKMRGYRIELDEIGSVLSKHPCIAHATAVLRKTPRGEEQIVAYVLPTDGTALPVVKALQEHLLVSLPQYMIPAVFVVLGEVPVSPNGKVDPALFPAPDHSNILGHPAVKQPSTQTEKDLLVLMQELLEQSGLTLEDNFFLAGGHSLLSMQLVLRLRKSFNVELALSELFGAPTVQQLAALVDQKRAEQSLRSIWLDVLNLRSVELNRSFFELGGDNVQLLALNDRIAKDFGKELTLQELQENDTIGKQANFIQNKTAKAELPLGVLPLRTHEGRRPIFWVHYLSADLARAMADDQSFVHLGLVTEDIALFGANPTMLEIARCFVSKILATQPHGPYIVGGFCLGGILAYEISSQLKSAGHEVSLLFMLDTPSPSYFKLTNVLTPRLSNPGYLLKRATKIGLRSIYQKVRARLRIYIHEALDRDPSGTEVERVQRMIEKAANLYRPVPYEGKVALILAADHPPHIDFLSEWRRFIPRGLHTQYLVAHHSELLNGSAVQAVAEAMASQVESIAAPAVAQLSSDNGRRLEHEPAPGVRETVAV
jgi:thioesterase domain-containing protein/acyl carrier protein